MAMSDASVPATKMVPGSVPTETVFFNSSFGFLNSGKTLLDGEKVQFLMSRRIFSDKCEIH